MSTKPPTAGSVLILDDMVNVAVWLLLLLMFRFTIVEPTRPTVPPDPLTDAVILTLPLNPEFGSTVT